MLKLSSIKGIRIDVPVLSASWFVEDHSVNIHALEKGLSSTRPVIPEESLAGSPLVQMAWQRLQVAEDAEVADEAEAAAARLCVEPVVCSCDMAALSSAVVATVATSAVVDDVIPAVAVRVVAAPVLVPVVAVQVDAVPVVAVATKGLRRRS